MPLAADALVRLPRRPLRLGTGPQPRARSAAAGWLGRVRTAYDLDGQSHPIFGTVSYAAKSRDRPRRVVVKAEHLRGPDGGKSNPRFLVTNCAGDPRALYGDHYCPRGDVEKRIKEQQLGLFADRTSCHAFAANQFRVLLAAAAYVLCDQIRRTALVGSALGRAEVGTIRLRLLHVGGLVQKTVRRIVVRIAGSFPGQDLFRRVVDRLRRSRHAPDTS